MASVLWGGGRHTKWGIDISREDETENSQSTNDKRPLDYSLAWKVISTLRGATDGTDSYWDEISKIESKLIAKTFQSEKCFQKCLLKTNLSQLESQHSPTTRAVAISILDLLPGILRSGGLEPYDIVLYCCGKQSLTDCSSQKKRNNKQSSHLLQVVDKLIKRDLSESFCLPLKVSEERISSTPRVVFLDDIRNKIMFGEITTTEMVMMKLEMVYRNVKIWNLPDTTSYREADHILNVILPSEFKDFREEVIAKVPYYSEMQRVLEILTLHDDRGMYHRPYPGTQSSTPHDIQTISIKLEHGGYPDTSSFVSEITQFITTDNSNSKSDIYQSELSAKIPSVLAECGVV